MLVRISEPAPSLLRLRFCRATVWQRWQNHTGGMDRAGGRMQKRWHAWSHPSHSSSSSSRSPRPHTSHTTSSIAGQAASPHTSPEQAQQSSSTRFGCLQGQPWQSAHCMAPTLDPANACSAPSPPPLLPAPSPRRPSEHRTRARGRSGELEGARNQRAPLPGHHPGITLLTHANFFSCFVGSL